jgi:hypothetical protein
LTEYHNTIYVLDSTEDLSAIIAIKKEKRHNRNDIMPGNIFDYRNPYFIGLSDILKRHREFYLHIEEQNEKISVWLEQSADFPINSPECKLMDGQKTIILTAYHENDYYQSELTNYKIVLSEDNHLIKKIKVQSLTLK